jgi:hypothetical protein
MPTTFLNATFDTISNNVNVFVDVDTGTAGNQAYVSESGHGISQHPAGSGSAVLRGYNGGSNGKVGAEAASITALLSATPPSADYAVIAEIERAGAPTASTGSVLLGLRVDGTVISGYFAGFDRSNSRWAIFRADTGTLTQIGTTTTGVSWPASTVYKFRFEANGSTLNLYDITGGGSTLLASATDSTYTAAGKASIRSSIQIVSSTTGYFFREVSAETLDTGATPAALTFALGLTSGNVTFTAPAGSAVPNVLGFALGLASGSVTFTPGSAPPYTFIANGIWTWFNYANQVRHNGIDYVGAINSAGRIVIAKNDAGTVTEVTFGTAVVNVNDHSNPSLLVLPDNRLMVVYSEHNGQAFYRISTNALPDISTFQAQVEFHSGTGVEVNSYTRVWVAPDGWVRILSRKAPGGTDNPTWLFAKRASEIMAGDTSWAAPVQQFGIPNARPYPIIDIEPDTGIVHLFTSSDHPNEGPAALYLYRGEPVSDGSLRWYRGIDGTEVTDAKPFDPRQAGALVMTTTGGVNWTWDIKRFPDGTICMASTKYPSSTTGLARNVSVSDIQYWVHRKRPGQALESWQFAGGQSSIYPAESCYAGGLVIDGNSPNIIYSSERVASLDMMHEFDFDWTTGVRTLRRMLDPDGTTHQRRPNSLRGHGPRAAVAWWDGSYSTFTNYNTRIRSIAELPGVPSLVNPLGFVLGLGRPVATFVPVAGTPNPLAFALSLGSPVGGFTPPPVNTAPQALDFDLVLAQPLATFVPSGTLLGLPPTNRTIIVRGG